MGRYAAPERAGVAIRLEQGLARQLELDDLQFLIGRREVGERHPHPADHAVNRRDARMHLDQGAHFDGPGAVRAAGIVAPFEKRDGLRGRNRDDAADPQPALGTNIAAVHDFLFPLCRRCLPGGGLLGGW